jgi:phosphoribosyl-ATP pyrophosphohydrolase
LSFDPFQFRFSATAVNHVDVLDRLMATIEHRRATRPAGSYTTVLLDGGLEAIGAKVREESGELIEAAAEPGEAGRQHAVREAADLVYHLLVLLAWREIPLADVEAELARRFGISGLDEKAARGQTPPPA